MNNYRVGTTISTRSLFCLVLLMVVPLGAVFCLGNEANATTYYVATNGNDSNPGTNSQPFRTINEGVQALSAGDTLYVKSGTYAESIRSTQVPIPNGTSWNNPITIAAHPGHTVTIRPLANNAFFWILDGQSKYLQIKGFIVDGANTALHGFKFEGGTKYVRVRDCEVKNAKHSGILVTNGNSTSASRINTHHEFLNLKVHHNGSSNGDHGFYIETSHNLVASSAFYHNKGNGGKFFHGHLSGAANNNIARNNTFYDNSVAGLWSCGLLLSSGNGNQAYNNVAYGNFAGFCIQSRVSNARLYNNVAYNNDVYGIYVGNIGNGTTSGSRVENNTAYQNGTYGIFVGEGATSTSVKNNIAWSNSNNLSLINTTSSHNSTSNPVFVNAANKDFHLHTSSPVIDGGISISGINIDYDGNPRPKGAKFDIGAYEFQGSNTSGGSSSVRYVRLVADSEVNGNPWTTIAELTVLDGNGTPLDQSSWSLQSVDSEELVGENGAALNAFDGNPATIWHTQWLGGSDAPPHEIVIDLGAVQTVSGFGYLPRQDGGVNGRIAVYRFYGSGDGVTWGSPLATGSFANSAQHEQVEFHGTRYVRLVANSEVNGNPWTTMSELTVLDGNGAPLDQSSWSLQSVDSEELVGENGAALNAFDGNSATIWHTQWLGGSDAPPHEIVIDLGAVQTVSGFGYLPRQDGGVNGRIAGYQFFGGLNGVTWGAPLATGTFANTATEQQVVFAGTRYVRLVAASEVDGNPFTTVAELTVLDSTGTPLDKSVWRRKSVDSEEVVGENGAATNAFDGNPATIWHTQWLGGSDAPPHEIVIDLGVEQVVRGFRYLPRQDGGTNGRIAEYQFYGSIDGVTWGVPRASGMFADTDQEQEVLF